MKFLLLVLLMLAVVGVGAMMVTPRIYYGSVQRESASLGRVHQEYCDTEFDEIAITLPTCSLKADPVVVHTEQILQIVPWHEQKRIDFNDFLELRAYVQAHGIPYCAYDTREQVCVRNNK